LADKEEKFLNVLTKKISYRFFSNRVWGMLHRLRGMDVPGQNGVPH